MCHVRRCIVEGDCRTGCSVLTTRYMPSPLLYFLIGLSCSLTNAVYWSAAVVATQTTPLLLSSDLQTHGTFYVLAGLNALAFIFVLTTVPETKV